MAVLAATSADVHAGLYFILGMFFAFIAPWCGKQGWVQIHLVKYKFKYHNFEIVKYKYNYKYTDFNCIKYKFKWKYETANTNTNTM